MCCLRSIFSCCVISGKIMMLVVVIVLNVAMLEAGMEDNLFSLVFYSRSPPQYHKNVKHSFFLLRPLRLVSLDMIIFPHSETFSFMLTGEDGSRRFGYCRRLLVSHCWTAHPLLPGHTLLSPVCCDKYVRCETVMWFSCGTGDMSLGCPPWKQARGRKVPICAKNIREEDGSTCGCWRQSKYYE